MDQRPSNAPQLTHEEQLERIQRLCGELQKALDASEEQRRILRDMARTAEELAQALESAATHNHALTRPRGSRKRR
jgi:N-glycosylase/DNA lyase